MILIIVNDAPYGTEKAYNAFRLALALQKEDAQDVVLFLMGDAVGCAVSGQVTPQGYYNLERMLRGVLTRGGKVKLCGTCCEARGFKNIALLENTELSTMVELSHLVVQAEKVITF